MPCTVPARGVVDSTWNDKVNNTPCGRKIVMQCSGGYVVSSHNMCLLHLMMKLGQSVVGPPYVLEP